MSTLQHSFVICLIPALTLSQVWPLNLFLLTCLNSAYGKSLCPAKHSPIAEVSLAEQEQCLPTWEFKTAQAQQFAVIAQEQISSG